MSQQRPGKRGMCSALRPTSDDCTRITACTSSNILQRLSFPPLYPGNRSALYVYLIVSLPAFHFLTSAVAMTETNSCPFIALCNLRLLIDDGARN